MSSNLRRLLSSGPILICCGALAAPTVVGTPAGAPVVDGPTQRLSDTLTRIDAETMVLKAREKQLGVQAAIVAKQQEIAARENDITRATQAPVQGRPNLVGIEGIGSVMVATLELDNGTTVDVQKGDQLPNGMRIVSIQPRSVTLDTGRGRVQLTQARRVPATFNAAFPAPGPLLPPLPQAAPGAGVTVRSAEK